jgi:hypothetical protein
VSATPPLTVTRLGALGGALLAVALLAGALLAGALLGGGADAVGGRWATRTTPAGAVAVAAAGAGGCALDRRLSPMTTAVTTDMTTLAKGFIDVTR